MSRFMFFQSYYESLRELPAEDFKAVVCAMCALVFDKEEPDLTGVQRTVFLLIRPVLEKSARIAEKRSIAGRLGGEAKPKQVESKHEAKEKQTRSKLEAKPKEDHNQEIVEIVAFFNDMCGSHYRPETASTRKKIVSILKQGFSVEDCKTVIEKKAKEWKGGKMERYLTPDTLFSGKFEGYLNQNVIEEHGPQNSKIHNFQERQIDYRSLEERMLAN